MASKKVAQPVATGCGGSRSTETAKGGCGGSVSNAAVQEQVGVQSASPSLLETLMEADRQGLSDKKGGDERKPEASSASCGGAVAPKPKPQKPARPRSGC